MSFSNDGSSNPQKPETGLVTAGRDTYGRHGSPTTRALQDVLMSLEGPQCAGVGLTPSGLAAITTTLLSVLSAGDHVLVTDNVYRPRPISATACSSAPASRSAISIR